MLTSEQQKIYNVQVPKGGYGYYTLYHGIYDPENDIDERPVYAQTGDLFEPEGSSVVYKATRRNGKTTWAIDENAQRQSESGESGGGSGGGLPADFPAEGIANANKFLGFDNSGDYAALAAPSGAEKFVVTLTQESDTWTADKTVAETVAAYEANKVVVAKYPDAGMYVELPLNMAMEYQGMYAAMFIGFGNSGNDNKIVSVHCTNQGSGDVITVTEQNIPTSTTEPLIVTLTAGSTEGQFVGDKTHKEAYDAYIAGRNVVFYAPAVNGMAETVATAENNTSAADPYALSTKSFASSGSADNYITVTVGG